MVWNQNWWITDFYFGTIINDLQELRESNDEHQIIRSEVFDHRSPKRWVDDGR